MKALKYFSTTITILILLYFFTFSLATKNDDNFGKFTYDNFKTPQFCGSCHDDIYRQWEKAMMSQAYTHEWDEIEYFKLAVPHADKNPKVAEVKADCNGCHSPMAYLAGDIPPQPPSKKTRANESVSCDICHSISGFAGDIPYNFNYIVESGDTKFSTRLSGVESPAHKIKKNPIMSTGDFCGICHNEKSPYDVWVKSTHLEWKEGPYYKEGVHCQNCHMQEAEIKLASMGGKYPDAKLHFFPGAHNLEKVKGTIEIYGYSDVKEAEPGDKVKFTFALFNQKTGHKFPTGSVEDRILWLHVEAIDAKGKKYHLPVDKKGFEGEEYTIATNVLAYQDMGIPLNDPEFKGLPRDAVPAGNRIFRMPYFDPQGRMTIQQWNTASLGVDYRIGPRETKIETFTFIIPSNISSGKLKVKAVLYYQLLVKSVGEYLKVPESEYTPIVVNEKEIEINIL